MAWLKLTHLDGRTAILNTDQISEISERNGSIETGIRSDGTLMFFRESVEEIGPMIEQGERAELVTRFALAIVESGTDVMMHDVWRMAAEYADAKPKIGGEL
jgi:uncharacterized protein YlzI (FlbEa/FlbD family)